MADACFELTRLNDRQKNQIGFWSNEAKLWPRDTLGHMFLARAVHTLGKALFPEWAGLEPVSFTVTNFDAKQLQPGSIVAGSERRRAKAVADHFGVTISSDPREIAETLNELMAGESPHRAAAIARMNSVQEAIINEAANDELATFTRLKSGGECYRQRVEEWNSEAIGFRFWLCQQELGKPYQAPLYGIGDQWIFVSANDLTKMIEPREARPTPHEKVAVVSKANRRPATDKEIDQLVDEFCRAYRREHGSEPARKLVRDFLKNHPEITVPSKQREPAYKRLVAWRRKNNIE